MKRNEGDALPTYQIVPYEVKVHVRGKVSETRPVDDLDGQGLKLNECVLGILHSVLGLELALDEDDIRRAAVLTVSRSTQGMGVSCLLEIGSSGIRSTLRGRPRRGRSRREFDRQKDDREWIQLKVRFFFRPGQHAGLMLVEKASSVTPAPALTSILRQSFQAEHSDLMLKIAPAMTPAAVQKMIQSRPAKSLVFRRPVALDTSGASSGAGASELNFEFRASPRRGSVLDLRRYSKKNGLLGQNKLMGVLATAMGDGATAKGLTKDGWVPAVEFKTDSGATRTVEILKGDDDYAVTLSFPLSEAGAGLDADEHEFVASLLAMREDLKGYGFDAATSDDLLSSGSDWQPDEDAKTWKVEWDDNRRHERHPNSGSISS